MSTQQNRLYLVTGATGFLGVQLCQDLRRNGHDVIALVRSKTGSTTHELLKIGVQIEMGDIDFLTLTKVLKGIKLDGIFHVAGLIYHTSDSKSVEEMYRSNVLSANACFEFSKEVNCRVVYLSSSGVVGCQGLSERDVVANDASDYCSEQVRGFPYYEQKIQVETVWRPRALRGEVDIIFMRPTLIIGPNDTRGGSTEIVKMLMKKEIPFRMAGGVSFVDVRDVSAAVVVAMTSTSARSGDTFLLTAANMSFTEFSTLVQECSGVSAPWLYSPPWLSIVGAAAIRFGLRCLLRPPDVRYDPVYVNMGLRFWNVDASKAKEVLGFRPRDRKETVLSTVQFIQKMSGVRSQSPSSTSTQKVALVFISFVFFLLMIVFLWK